MDIFLVLSSQIALLFLSPHFIYKITISVELIYVDQRTYFDVPKSFQKVLKAALVTWDGDVTTKSDLTVTYKK